MTPDGLPSIGETLAGKYRLTRELGHGGMGVVYEAEHLRLGQRVAVKMMLSKVAAQPEFARRFEREARAAAKLRGPHTVRVYDVDETSEGLPFLVMELLEGHSLRDELARRGPLSIEDALRYVREACEGVGEAHHAGIIHRDLKPANLFLSAEGERHIVKVVDFGIAKASGPVENEGCTSTNAHLGTCKYMSPEQARSARSVDARTDVWSLGVVLYELLAGRTPFHGEGNLGILYAVATQPPSPLRISRPDVPAALAAVVERALCKDPAGRYQTVRALSDDLALLLEGRALSRSPCLTAPAPAPLTFAVQAALSLEPARAPDQGLMFAETLTAAAQTDARASGSPPLGASLEPNSNENISGGSKSHVVPVELRLPIADLRPVPVWLVCTIMIAFLFGGSLTLSFQAMRRHVREPPLPSVDFLASVEKGAAQSALLYEATPLAAPTSTTRAKSSEPAKGESAPTLAALHLSTTRAPAETSSALPLDRATRPNRGKARPKQPVGETGHPATPSASPSPPLSAERRDVDHF